MFLTAPNEEVLIPLFKDSFHTAYKPNAKSPCGYETYHSTMFFLIDQQGAIRGEYASGDPEQMARLEKDAQVLFTQKIKSKELL
jgi:cytochrome oxidase Cu insertion factor (SCO1/SenC/PrrC family)